MGICFESTSVVLGLGLRFTVFNATVGNISVISWWSVLLVLYQMRNQPIRNKNCLWWPCLLTDRKYMSNLYRGPSKDASYQISIHLAKRLQRWRFFRNQPTRNKNCLWQPCLVTDRDEMSNPYRRPAIDASYQVSVHLAKQFQRRRFLKIS